MSITPQIRQEILAEHAKNPQRFSPFRTSKALGVPITDVLSVVDKNKDMTARMSARYDGFGRPDIQKFAVARRRAMGEGWHNDSEDVANARKAYEAGTHVMATGRDGPWLILYLFPRRGPKQPRPDYFSTETF